MMSILSDEWEPKLARNKVRTNATGYWGKETRGTVAVGALQRQLRSRLANAGNGFKKRSGKDVYSTRPVSLCHTAAITRHEESPCSKDLMDEAQRKPGSSATNSP